MLQGSATTADHVEPPSVVRYISPPAVVATPIWSVVKSRSVGGTGESVVAAGVPGTDVRRDHVLPLSVERRTVPSPSSSTPVAGVGKSTAWIPPKHDSSLAVHGRRRNVRPPSSERRSAQIPPTTTESGLSTRTVDSGSVSPVA